MNRLILIGILWSRAISVGWAQETAESKEAGQSPTPAIEQPSPFRPAESRPVEPKRITLVADVDGEPSETVMGFLADLERDGVAKVEVKGKASTSEWPIQLNFLTKEDESLEKIRQFIVALRQSGVEQISYDFGRHHSGENFLLFTAISGHDDFNRLSPESGNLDWAAWCSSSEASLDKPPSAVVTVVSGTTGGKGQGDSDAGWARVVSTRRTGTTPGSGLRYTGWKSAREIAPVILGC